jgi:hypothetical protein
MGQYRACRWCKSNEQETFLCLEMVSNTIKHSSIYDNLFVRTKYFIPNNTWCGHPNKKIKGVFIQTKIMNTLPLVKHGRWRATGLATFLMSMVLLVVAWS